MQPGTVLGRGRGDVRELRRRLLPGEHRVRGLRDVRARGLLEHGRRLVRELRRRHLPKYPWASVVRQLRRRHLLGLRRSALHEVRGGFIYGCDCFHGVHELQSGHLFDGLRGDCFVRLRKLPCRRVFRPCSFSVLSVRCRDLCRCGWCHELRELTDGYVFDLGRRGVHDVRGGQIFLGPRGFKLQKLHPGHLSSQRGRFKLHKLHPGHLSSQRGPDPVCKLRRRNLLGWYGSLKFSGLFQLPLGTVFGGGRRRLLALRCGPLRG